MGGSQDSQPCMCLKTSTTRFQQLTMVLKKFGEVNPKPAIPLPSSLLGFEGLIKEPLVLFTPPQPSLNQWFSGITGSFQRRLFDRFLNFFGDNYRLYYIIQVPFLITAQYWFLSWLLMQVLVHPRQGMMVGCKRRLGLRWFETSVENGYQKWATKAPLGIQGDS